MSGYGAMLPILSAEAARGVLRGASLVSAEFMHRPRPAEPRRRRLFDACLGSRLEELSGHPRAAVVFLVDAPATASSLRHLPARFPALAMRAVVVNPAPASPIADDPTPFSCEWEAPDRWRRYALTDRWARLLAALDLVADLPGDGSLVLPAHDALWGRGLLDRLRRESERHARGGQRAAVSPYTPFQHSPVPGVAIPPALVDALNAAFARDSLLRWRMRLTRYQGFWGKTGLLPFGMAARIRPELETMAWEDDLEMDRAIRAAGFAARAVWVADPACYRQAPPVFSRDDLRAVLDRTLHYSLAIPGAFPGAASGLHRPLRGLGRVRRRVNGRFRRALALSEAIVADCSAAIARRVDHCGVSWVDWGAYRYVARPGDPAVQVWKRV